MVFYGWPKQIWHSLFSCSIWSWEVREARVALALSHSSSDVQFFHLSSSIWRSKLSSSTPCTILPFQVRTKFSTSSMTTLTLIINTWRPSIVLWSMFATTFFKRLAQILLIVVGQCIDPLLLGATSCLMVTPPSGLQTPRQGSSVLASVTLAKGSLLDDFVKQYDTCCTWWGHSHSSLANDLFVVEQEGILYVKHPKSCSLPIQRIA